MKGCDRLIVDLRGNAGGGLAFLRVMSYLTPDRVPVGYSVTRARGERVFKRFAGCFRPHTVTKGDAGLARSEVRNSGRLGEHLHGGSGSASVPPEDRVAHRQRHDGSRGEDCCLRSGAVASAHRGNANSRAVDLLQHLQGGARTFRPAASARAWYTWAIQPERVRCVPRRTSGEEQALLLRNLRRISPGSRGPQLYSDADQGSPRG